MDYVWESWKEAIVNISELEKSLTIASRTAFPYGISPNHKTKHAPSFVSIVYNNWDSFSLQLPKRMRDAQNNYCYSVHKNIYRQVLTT